MSALSFRNRRPATQPLGLGTIGCTGTTTTKHRRPAIPRHCPRTRRERRRRRATLTSGLHGVA